LISTVDGEGGAAKPFITGVGSADAVGTVVGGIDRPLFTVGTVTGENVIEFTAGPIATHNVFTVYVPGTFEVNATVNVESLTLVTVPTTTFDVGTPLASNT